MDFTTLELYVWKTKYKLFFYIIMFRIIPIMYSIPCPENQSKYGWSLGKAPSNFDLFGAIFNLLKN